MAFNLSLTRVLVALYLVCAVFAGPAFDVFVNEPGNGGNVTVAVNVPSNSSDELFFHFSASTLWQWTAFGFGQQMKGALMFVVYPAKDQKNITISPRVASGHSMPSLTKDVQVHLLNGSGIKDGNVFVVNAHCVGCRKWASGGIDITSEKQDLIYALGPKTESFTSDDISASIQRHDPGNHGQFTLNLKKATGDAGVPVLAADTKLTETNSDEAETKEFPIAVHALLLIACFLFVLPGGYLFLRVFNRVWLHAGVQSFGLICALAGVAAGIVYNAQTKKQISYHQVLGIITTVLLLAAFTLGLISHQYFKKRKVSSPLMKFHRMAGPSSIVFGWGTIISGFAFRGEPRRILPFMVVLLAVIIFIASIAFLMKKRAVKKAALVTPAAQNFNAAYYSGESHGNVPPSYGNQTTQGYYASNAGHNESVPMQTFGRPYEQSRGRSNVGYPQQTYKAPDVNVRQVNQI